MLTRRVKVSTKSATRLLSLCRYADECDCPVHHEAITGGLRAVEEEARIPNRDTLAKALWEPYEHNPESPWGKCRACGEDGVDQESINVDAIIDILEENNRWMI